MTSTNSAKAVSAIFSALAGKKRFRLVITSLLLVLLGSVNNSVYATKYKAAMSTPSQVAGGTICTGVTLQPIFAYQIAISTGGTTTNAPVLTTMTYTTTGTYVSTDVTQYKLWYNTTGGAFSAGSATLLATSSATNAGPQSFTGMSLNMASAATTFYFYITVDIPSGAAAHTMTVSTALASTNFTFTGGAPAGFTTSATAGNSQSIGTSPTGVTATPSPTSMCLGAALTLTGAASGATTYLWSGPTGGAAMTSTSTLSTSVAVTNLSNSGVYTLTATSASGCSTSATTTAVTVNPGASVSPTTAAICNGGSVTLNSTLLTTVTNLIPQNSFETGVPTSSTLVAGWGAAGTYATSFSQQNTTLTANPTIGAAENGTSWLGWQSYNISGTAQLYSPSFSLTGISGATVSFWWWRDPSAYNNATYAAEGVTVYINTTNTITGGTSMGFVPRDGVTATSGGITGTSTTSTGGWYQYTCTIPGTYTGATNYIVFNFNGVAGDNCNMDNVNLTYLAPTGLTWSPIANLYTNSTFTTAYTSGTATTVYYHPTTITTTTTNVITSSYSGCNATTTVTVTAAPVATAGGTSPVCVGATTTVSDATTGGTWSTTAGSGSVTLSGTATTTVTVTGLTPGTATINYTTGCGTASHVITVNGALAITGAGTFCQGSVLTLNDATSGGTWQSSATGVATVDGSGNVTGVGGGTATISYTVSGCSQTTVVSVTPIPAAIGGGTSAICPLATTLLTDVTPAGTWSSLNTSVATVGSTGIVTGVAPGGTATIQYSTGCGTAATAVVTVNITSLSGGTSVCVGNTTTLTPSPTGGTWASSNTSYATVDGSGNVTGVAIGAVNITYYSPTGCTQVQAMAVGNTSPPAINGGTTPVCTSTSITLSDATSGGLWISSNTAVATVGSTGSTVTLNGLTAGTAIITYTNGCGTAPTTIVTVNGAQPITGNAPVCSGSTITLNDITGGGTWMSNATGIATVDGSGNVNGVTAGNATISYTLAGCSQTVIATVNATGVISGISSICSSVITTLTAVPSGGTWQSMSTGVAT